MSAKPGRRASRRRNCTALPPPVSECDQRLGERFESTVVAFMDLVEAAKRYPCAKKAWIEFLGEQPDSVADRVDVP